MRRAAGNGLMIAFAFTLPYHVMRTAAAAGLRVRVLGSGASRGLRVSRHCRAYHETGFAGDPEILLAEIREITRHEAIDIVFPSDDVSTRLLALVADRLPVRCVRLPATATFDVLNDKWNFTRFCRSSGVRAPEGWLFDTAEALRRALGAGEVALPITVKPTNRSGGAGVIHLRQPDEIARIDAIDYRPVLVQRHIVGEEASITVLCDNGRVVADVAQQRDAVRFRILSHPDLLDNVSRLIALTGSSGVFNFDAVLSDGDGLAYLVECNPRFWYSIYLVMIAGLNFVDLVLRGAAARPAPPLTLDSGEIRLSPGETLFHPWRASRLDWRLLAYNLGDPLAYLALRSKAYDDSDVAVPASPMRPAQRAIA